MSPPALLAVIFGGVGFLSVVVLGLVLLEEIRSTLRDMHETREKFLKVMEDDNEFRLHIRDTLSRIEERLNR